MSIPIRPLEKIREVLASIPEAQSVDLEFKSGEILLREGEPHTQVSLIIRGEIELLKHDEDGEEYPLGILRPGQFLGLLLLSSGESSFFTARARSEGAMLCIPQHLFLDLLHQQPDFNQVVGPLLLGNLVDRYRRVVRLHLEVADLSRDLEAEKRQLQATIEQLEDTRNLMIQQEKMATLGQLVAGIAHEINNPIASLSRAADSIEPQMLRFFTGSLDGPAMPLMRQAFLGGLNRKPLQTEAHRARVEILVQRYASLPRALLRSLAQVEPQLFDEVEASINRLPAGERMEWVRRWVDVFEAGAMIRNMRLASSRIGNMVRSLKGYSRQDKSVLDEVDLREGLNDTLVLFGYKLKKFNVILDLRDIPSVRCRPSEMNQVWTNLILNACQAMGESGTLRVACGSEAPDRVWVRIQDSGPGIPESLLDRIFESGFSTKQDGASEEAGSGLGLAIAQAIVEHQRGNISAENAPEGGACFTVKLPTMAADE